MQASFESASRDRARGALLDLAAGDAVGTSPEKPNGRRWRWSVRWRPSARPRLGALGTAGEASATPDCEATASEDPSSLPGNRKNATQNGTSSLPACE